MIQILLFVQMNLFLKMRRPVIGLDLDEVFLSKIRSSFSV